MFSNFFSRKKKREKLSQISSTTWPKYLYNTCNNSNCNHTNPPQAAQGRYVCCGVVGGKPCRGTYHVSEDAVALVMKQHKAIIRKEEKAKREAAEPRPEPRYRAFDNTILIAPNPIMTDHSVKPENPAPDPAHMISDPPKREYRLPQSHGANSEVRPPEVPPKPLPRLPPSSVSKNVENDVRPEKKTIRYQDAYGGGNRSTPHLTAGGHEAVSWYRPKPVSAVKSTATCKSDAPAQPNPRFHFQEPHLIKETLYYRSQSRLDLTSGP